jgi:hypothetical protein
MKIICLFVTVILGLCTAGQAAPVESVESARASVAQQKVEAFFSEKVVQDQMVALGIKSEQVQARLAQLSENQLEQIAVQVDLLKAGGTIQHGFPNRLGALGCVLYRVGLTFRTVYRLLFCWPSEGMV